jgi:hypothetical protein
MELPPLLSAKHVMYICSCSRPTAYEIMNQPHRVVWQNGKGTMKRLLRDTFLEQLEQECKQQSA